MGFPVKWVIIAGVTSIVLWVIKCMVTSRKRSASLKQLQQKPNTLEAAQPTSPPNNITASVRPPVTETQVSSGLYSTENRFQYFTPNTSVQQHPSFGAHLTMARIPMPAIPSRAPVVSHLAEDRSRTPIAPIPTSFGSHLSEEPIAMPVPTVPPPSAYRFTEDRLPASAAPPPSYYSESIQDDQESRLPPYTSRANSTL
ncbi:hypothetical protein M422DRAFT_37654 [Sphaerobolus stellatus SS14]|uniref:Uncharacterized protein n=1 Tax=Sphaerobolus stellatus (strain SS14) TaxID=990650 RepID=A0A0C9U0Y7_SPHS4|nr:hypothetical protein M422DRAFT_37654 [Sphaerobolus stellatus SS14]